MLNRKTLASWEFISFVFVSVGAWLLEWGDKLSGAQAIYLSAAAAGVTAVSRGLAKHDSDTKNWWETTEFWVAVIGGAQATLAQLVGVANFDTSTLAFVLSGIAGALAIGRGLGKDPALAASDTSATTRKPTKPDK